MIEIRQKPRSDGQPRWPKRAQRTPLRTRQGRPPAGTSDRASHHPGDVPRPLTATAAMSHRARRPAVRRGARDARTDSSRASRRARRSASGSGSSTGPCCRARSPTVTARADATPAVPYDLRRGPPSPAPPLSIRVGAPVGQSFLDDRLGFWGSSPIRAKTYGSNTRDISRKVAACISPKCRKAKRNQRKPPLEPELGLEFTKISYRRTEKRNHQRASRSMQVLCGHGVRLLCGS